MLSSHDPRQNRLLAVLDPTQFERILPDLELVKLTRGEALYQPGGKLTHIYFPTSSIISIQYDLENGDATEIASVGNEGLLGVALFMGGITTSSRAVVQSSGAGYRLRAARLIEEFYRQAPLLRLLLRYTQALMTQMSQTAVCNARHSTPHRLSRWLLQAFDHSNLTELTITQETLGSMLGVRREGITDAAGKLQSMGLIRYRRGHVRILDRAGLEHYVCECYSVIRGESARLLSDTRQWQDSANNTWFERDGTPTRRHGNPERRTLANAAPAPPGAAQASFAFSGEAYAMLPEHAPQSAPGKPSLSRPDMPATPDTSQ